MQGEKPLTLQGFIEFLRDFDISKCFVLQGGASIVTNNEQIVKKDDKINYLVYDAQPPKTCEAISCSVVEANETIPQL